MAAGVPALAVLVITTLVGFVVGMSHFGALEWRTKNYDRNLGEIESRHSVALHACVVGVVSITFWIWSLVLCFSLRFDLGSITFLIAFVAAYSGYRLGRIDTAYHARWHSNFMVSACSLVALNYILACLLCHLHFIISSGALSLYFFIGAIWWIAAGSFGFAFSRRLEAELEGRYS
eukprot:TRINITY_DN76928_c0_g1_i1.p1 TRINITY_DN76928_c0_g1~~TRINITY_DN76928_c0_g1_i1.p1  ORF type:complete len:185 (-),score=13.47 TRINITY_DN76928_c0_g1_i1:217-744(-)